MAGLHYLLIINVLLILTLTVTARVVQPDSNNVNSLRDPLQAQHLLHRTREKSLAVHYRREFT